MSVRFGLDAWHKRRLVFSRFYEARKLYLAQCETELRLANKVHSCSFLVRFWKDSMKRFGPVLEAYVWCFFFSISVSVFIKVFFFWFIFCFPFYSFFVLLHLVKYMYTFFNTSQTFLVYTLNIFQIHVDLFQIKVECF